MTTPGLKEYIQRDFRYLAIIFLAALLIRILFVYAISTSFDAAQVCQLVPDSAKYIKAAQYLTGTEIDGESELFLVGPGYPFFVGFFLRIFGMSGWPIFLVQVLLSSLSCCLIYLLALRLLEDHKAAVTAGLLSAFSITSISLSAVLLTETLFFFLFLLSLNLYLDALSQGHQKSFVYSGLIGGVAALVRSVSQFFWLPLLLFAFIYPDKYHIGKRSLKKPITAIAIMILIIAAWGFRNYAIHGVFTVADTGLGAARIYLVPRVICDADPTQNLKKLRAELEAPQTSYDRPQTPKERHDESAQIVRTALKNHPAQFFKTYFKIVWENMTEFSIIHPKQLPQYLPALRDLDRFLTHNGRKYLVTVLSFAGLIILLLQKKFVPAIIIFTTLLYFILQSGVTYWQGSRIFFPAQSVWTILLGVVFSRILAGAGTIISSIQRTKNKKPA